MGLQKGFKFKFMHFLNFVQKHWKIMHFRVSQTLVKQTKTEWKTWEFEKDSTLKVIFFESQASRGSGER